MHLPADLAYLVNDVRVVANGAGNSRQSRHSSPDQAGAQLPAPRYLQSFDSKLETAPCTK